MPYPAAADPLGRHDSGARAQKRIEDDVTPARAVAHRVSDERDRLDGRMHGELIHAAGAETVDAGRNPNVGAITPVLTQFDNC